ncbi:MAG: B12-binding domain-containing radical SAM protein [Candidatus Thermoplasmatota archaeon]|nr:B12-binding domain-containing radical SAM protein [Candidatus Thermoplasmatota archaeon]MBU1940849.1 B12-binding domain-containing radical SAM protein [Candidatus Thermoplasmatota archaeon]
MEDNTIRILLIYPEVTSFFIQDKHLIYGLAPPLGLLYLAAILEQNGHAVSVLDFSAEPYSKTTLKNNFHQQDVIGITVLTPAVDHVKNLIHDIKTIDASIPIIIGGPHCSLFPQQSLTTLDADVCVIGDAESRIHHLISNIHEKKTLATIPGIVYHHKNTMQTTPQEQMLPDLNTLPFPARHLVDQYIYGRGYNPRFHAHEFTTILFSRGCPYRCTFCSRSAINLHQFRRRTPTNILKELDELTSAGYTHIAVKDDCFPVVKKEAHTILDGIIAKNHDFNLYLTASRVNLLDAELLKKMRRAGVKHIQFGLESGNQKVLDYYKKQTTLEQIRKIVTLSHNLGFFTAGTFILGAPFETTTEIQKTISFAQSLPLNSVSFLPLRYMAGSELWKQAVAEKRISEKQYIVNADAENGLSTFNHDTLVSLSQQAQLHYYLRPQFFYHLLKTVIRQQNPSILLPYFLMIKPNR